jgi:16S rRNA (uracil1498-N3)-methyltransferase
MPRLFVPPELLRGARVTLDAAAHRHLIKVQRLEPGAVLQVFDGTGTEIEARIVAVGKASLDVELGERRRLPAAPCRVTLLVAVPRGERMDLIVQKTTELGVARIVPVASARSMVKPSPHQQARWQTIAAEAARQSGRAEVPVVAATLSLPAALAGAAAESTPRFLVWEGERDLSLPRALTSEPRAVALLVGPEGGFADREVGEARAAGFQSVGLGPRILRAETAAIVAVALAQAAAGGFEP